MNATAGRFGTPAGGPVDGFTCGQPAEDKVAAALAKVASSLPYLRAATGKPEVIVHPGDLRPGDLAGAYKKLGEAGCPRRWFACDELLADADWLGRVVQAAGRELGAPTAAVAASLFVQGYAYRVLALGVSALFLGGAVPSSQPIGMAVAFSKGRPAFVSYGHPRALVAPPGWADGPAQAAPVLEAVIEDAVEDHLRPLVEATLSRVRVGRRLLWGNVAASAAVAFRTVEGLVGSGVKPLGELFFSLVPPDMRGQGSFATVEHAGGSIWYWERRNCCLYDRLPSKIRCADCSKTAPDERREAYRSALEQERPKPG